MLFSNKSRILGPFGDSLSLVRAGGTFRLPARLLSDPSSCASAFPIATESSPVPTSVPSVEGSSHKEERDRHFLTHLPPAPWCPVCVQARSGDAMHHVQPRDELFDPARPTVIQMDYTFGRQELLKVMDMIHAAKGFAGATAVPVKGGKHLLVSKWGEHLLCTRPTLRSPPQMLQAKLLPVWNGLFQFLTCWQSRIRWMP